MFLSQPLVQCISQVFSVEGLQLLLDNWISMRNCFLHVNLLCMHLRCLDPILQTRSELPNDSICCHLATLVRKMHAVPTCERIDDNTCHAQQRWVQECPLHWILRAPANLSSTPCIYGVILSCLATVAEGPLNRPPIPSCIELSHD